MLPDIFDLKNLGGDLSALKDALDSGKSTSVFYTTSAARAHIASKAERFFLYVTPDRLSARKAAEILTDYCEKEVVLIPEKDDVLINPQVTLTSALKERMTALTKVFEKAAAGAVISAEGLQQFFPSVRNFEKVFFKLKTGECIMRESVLTKLTKSGYRREETVSIAGSFSVRGEILDVWPINYDSPVRVEFFDDEIESLRFFAPDSLVSVRSVDSVIISPKSDILLPEESLPGILKLLDSVKRNASYRLNEVAGEVKEKLLANPSDPSLVWALPFAQGEFGLILDYLPEDSIIILDETRAIDDKIKLNTNAHNIRVKSFAEAGEVSARHTASIASRERIYEALSPFLKLGFQQITSSNPIFEPDAVFSIKALPVTRYNLSYAALVNDIKSMIVSGTVVYIYAGSTDAAKSIAAFLMENDLSGVISADGRANHEIIIIPERISKGFHYPAIHVMAVGSDELQGRADSGKKSAAKKRQAFIVPVKGDYVVHEKHGIGICEGIIPVETKSGTRDYCVVLYKDGDKLYLPVDQMNTLEKYTGGGTPSIHKLGGKEFERVKERVKKSIKALAVDLVDLYGKRAKIKGHRYQPDTVWQKELEESFEFTETDDQLIAVSEIKEDMESGKVMDRLLCGDVGFGKTEVAIRAIFKTVIEGKQAAVLAPTTVLCQQHFNLLKSRFNNFGIKIDVLSRFESPESIKQALERIKSGKTSVVVATHRILGKDVVFKDLGLLVLDEEQRFGVEHKEKIKVLKNNVNVLSLSATPIPRTLHMALSGIRDISTLETPPAMRLPVETFVVEYSDALLKDAVNREIRRGGQVLILFNRVQGIEAFTRQVTELLDAETRVIYAHGQLADADLEERIRAFYNKEADVLIATTIIENGIDIPDANTLIVIDSDRLGLSALYQLRGRVGRSTNLAYAYFTVREGKALTENAEKRLDALLSNTELGSGFKIAMQDLEIRGAGNILGREQHGNMEKVGYDMYCRLLNECVGEIKGMTPEIKREVEIVVDGEITLPQDYIADGERRVKFYKNVAVLDSLEEQKRLIDGIKDAYGAPPQSVLNLIAIGLIKNLAATLNIKRINAAADGLYVVFYDASGVFANENLMNAVAVWGKKCVLTPQDPPVILFQNKYKSASERLVALEKFLLLAVKGGLTD